jgi:hypothetical protein
LRVGFATRLCQQGVRVLDHVCLRLTYESQRERLLARVLSKAYRLRDRLGGIGEAFSFGSKPKGIHHRTYKRLIMKLEDLRCDFYGCLAVQFRFKGFENPDDLEEGDLGYRKPRSYRRRTACSE